MTKYYIDGSGRLCSDLFIFKRYLFTLVNVDFVFEGTDISGNIINDEDFSVVGTKMYKFPILLNLN